MPFPTFETILPIMAGKSDIQTQNLEGDPFQKLRDEMARAFGNLAPSLTPSFASPMDFLKGIIGQPGVGFNPQTKIVETDKAVEVSMNLPGLEEKDVGVSIADGLLTIKAGHKSETENKGAGFQVCERRFSMIQHAMSLPPGTDMDISVVRFSDGVLTVPRPKKTMP